MTRIIILFFSLAILFTSALNAQTKFNASTFVITIDGTSNMHNWSTKATKVNVTGDFNVNNTGLQKINSAKLQIETKSLKSVKKYDLMDSRTYSTLKADKYPSISFVFVEVLSKEQNGKVTTMNVAGNLTIAGVTKTTELILKITTLPNGDLEVKGNRKIMMSTFGIKPPSFMLGALKVGDEINITYNVTLKKA